MRLRVVLDTNVVLDWLVFLDPSTRVLALALETRRVTCITDHACRSELERVLAYPQFALESAAREHILARYDAFAELTDNAPYALSVPRCSDADDQKFLDLAYRSGAELLITKDRALLDCARKTRRALRIIAPHEAAHFLDGAKAPSE